MSKTFSGLSLTIVGLLIGALGVFAPIAWDLWSKRSEVVLEARQSVTILEKEKSIQKLEIMYGGKPINSLSKTILILKNTGRTPISKDDVLAPPTIRFANSEVLEVTVTRQSPPNLHAQVSATNHQVSIAFQLLNPGDELELSVLTAEGSPIFTADARIKNVSKLLVLNFNNQQKAWWKVGFAPYIAGIFGLLFSLIGIGILFEIPAKKRAKLALLSENGPMATINTKLQALEFANNSLRFLSGDNKKAVFNLLNKFNDPLSEADRKNIIERMQLSLENEDSAGPALVAIALGIIGTWYAISSFIA